MRKVGRNDPCHCGSGVKYKYCCLQKDQEEANASSASESEATATSQMSSSTESRTLSPAEKTWDTFDASDYEDQKALVDEITGDPDRMDAENAFNMLNRLYSKTIERGDSEWLLSTLNRLRTEQPETYAAELPYLLSYHLHAAAARGQLDTVAAEHVDDLATVASQNIDEFYPSVQLIAYHSSLAPLAEATQDAWDAVRKNSDIMPFAKDRFANRTIEYAILAHYEQHGTVDLETSDLQTLINRIDATEHGEVDTDYVERFADRLSGPNDQAWQVRDDPAENVHWLTVDFMCAVFEETDVPLGRAHLARGSIENGHLRPYEGAGLMDIKDLLHLTQRSVREQLEEMGSFMSSHPHRRDAFFALLPTWLEFLEDRQLLSSETADSTYRNLHSLLDGVIDTLSRLSTDPALVRDVETAWE